MSQMLLFGTTEVDDHFATLLSALGVREGPAWPDRFGESLRAWSAARLPSPIRTLSLFSGMGGLDIAFHDAGFQVLELVEIEERFAASLQRNSGKDGYLGPCEVHCIDIRKYAPREGARFDFIIGGPPCQSFSAAARRASGVRGVNDDRGVLFQEYVRLLRLVRPKGFLFENVYGITGANGGEAWTKIQQAFAAAGYKVFSRLFDAADFGVPQHRERIFIVGVLEGEFRFPEPSHGPDSCGERPYYPARTAVDGVAVSPQELAARVRGRYEGYLEQVPPGLNYSFFTKEMGHPKPVFAWRSKFSDFLYKADPDTPVRTLKAQAGQYTGPFHWDNRPFTVAELKRLQTIPDSYEIVGGRQAAVHQIGNSVPPQLARMLALAVLDQVFRVGLPAPLAYLGQSQSLGFRTRKRSLTSRYRRKAKTAIDTLGPDEQSQDSVPRCQTASRVLSDRFGWAEGNGNSSISVTLEANEARWMIQTSEYGIKPAPAAFSMFLTPRGDKGWNLDVPCVQLAASAYKPKVFTAAWKAFEEELIRRHIKADVVQLCNYYQYEPSFSVRFTPRLAIPSREWDVVRRVCEGVGCRATLPAGTLAELWECEVEDVLRFALFLRKLGYEVRNSNTNPEIPAGNFLIPYAFPTLSPKSVQLNKSLV
jgi:DNA (cytosine-5)-methyltransferase 1